MFCKYSVDGSYTCKDINMEPFSNCKPGAQNLPLPYLNRVNCKDACSYYSYMNSCPIMMTDDPNKTSGTCECPIDTNNTSYIISEKATILENARIVKFNDTNIAKNAAKNAEDVERDRISFINKSNKAQYNCTPGSQKLYLPYKMRRNCNDACSYFAYTNSCPVMLTGDINNTLDTCTCVNLYNKNI